MGFLSATKPFNFPIFTGEEYLSEEESEQLGVLFDRLFPADRANGVPGARDAKAVRFVSRLLALDEEEYHKIVEWREAYRHGLPELDKAARASFFTPLAELSAEDADTFLSRLEGGNLTGLEDDFDQRGFFRMLLEHCLKGCFADPRWGGNNAGIMWRWLGWIQPAEDVQFGGN